MKNAFAVFALAVMLFGGFAVGASAKTVCDSSVPPICEEVKTTRSGGRSAQFFFKELGLDVSPELAREVWRHPELREQVIAAWRTLVFSNK